jgi:hypothetical protein
MINHLFLKPMIVLLLLLASFNSCNEEKKKPIEQVMKDNQEMLLSIEGVQGIYQGQLADGSDCIVVMVEEENAETENKIPKVLEGYPVIIEAGGKIKPL